MLANHAYIPGVPREEDFTLARFLPRLERGVISTWLADNIPVGSLVIDPYGASPQLAIEAANAGYRVIVASNNPITRFHLQFSANSSSHERFQSVISALAATRVGKERLEPYILSGYKTRCDECGREIIAKAYLWNAGEDSPYARIYACPPLRAQR